MTDLREPDTTDLGSPEVETERIMRTGHIWLTAVVGGMVLAGAAVLLA